ncbi:NOSIC domain-containing protein [Rozella allomycis CSF55]|uniref:Nucleolar protein 56 n=1 Tax=Rozella allomycis (strain CSF55) TaxID=988480 RepID=A0A075ASS8_ROZAC|nr:NOSIC domain-containing protein [Rozella allomycis CSF55]|eukprot:EPZ33215.1 NOSIC domain-containing protein [Rozella allomycis CSF55]
MKNSSYILNLPEEVISIVCKRIPINEVARHVLPVHSKFYKISRALNELASSRLDYLFENPQKLTNDDVDWMMHTIHSSKNAIIWPIDLKSWVNIAKKQVLTRTQSVNNALSYIENYYTNNVLTVDPNMLYNLSTAELSFYIQGAHSGKYFDIYSALKVFKRLDDELPLKEIPVQVDNIIKRLSCFDKLKFIFKIIINGPLFSVCAKYLFSRDVSRKIIRKTINFLNNELPDFAGQFFEHKLHDEIHAIVNAGMSKSLFKAAINANSQKYLDMLKLTADEINSCLFRDAEYMGWLSPLAHALLNNKLEAASWLFKKGISPEETIEHGYNSLHVLVQTGAVEGLKWLFERFPNLVHEYSNGLPLLIHAINCEEVDIVMLLLEYGADANKPDIIGKFPIHYVMEIEQTNDVRDLIIDLLYMYEADFTKPLFILFETASGYALFERVQSEEIGQELGEVQKSILDLSKFGQMIKLKSFMPFKSAGDALENINDISEGIVGESLKNFLEMNLGNAGKKSKITIGVSDKALASSIKQELEYNCSFDEVVLEIIRGIRYHGEKMLKQFKQGDLARAQLGLGHSYSRAKVKFNVNRSDNMIIQAISLLDQLDKDVNTFSMRIREWYSWHFPELVRLVNDNAKYAVLAKLIGDKSTLSEDKINDITKIVDGDEDLAQHIIDAARSSMGTDISPIDLINIKLFADRVISLNEYRARLFSYLQNKMNIVAPNLATLIGEIVGARLIAHAGSLTNLSKYPASTVQILGAEKALFRALKTRGKTPKYGLIFHSSFIGRAGAKNKGRISRYLANKCSIASRIDCFSENPTTKFGEALKSQVEERMMFYESGLVPRKNTDVMQEVMQSIDEVPMKEEETDEIVPKEEIKEKKSKEEKKKDKEEKKKHKSLKEKKSKKSKA